MIKIVVSSHIKELFDSIAPQNTENRTVAKSLPAFLKYSVKCLFFKRLCQAVENLKYVLNQAYNALNDASNESNKGMGTTLTFLAFHSNGVLAAHIGDSRIYQIRPHEG